MLVSHQLWTVRICMWITFCLVQIWWKTKSKGGGWAKKKKPCKNTLNVHTNWNWVSVGDGLTWTHLDEYQTYFRKMLKGHIRMLLSNGGIFLSFIWLKTESNITKQTHDSCLFRLMFCWGLYKGKNIQCCAALVAALMLQWAQRLNNVRLSEDCQKLTVELLFHAVVQVCHLTIYWESRTIKLELLRGQILTHKAGSLLRVVAQRSRVWGESSGSVHSSGTAVRCGPFPLSQIYKATYDSTGSCHNRIFQAIRMFSSFFYSNCNFVLATILQWANPLFKGTNNREKSGRVEEVWTGEALLFTKKEMWDFV